MLFKGTRNAEKEKKNQKLIVCDMQLFSSFLCRRYLQKPQFINRTLKKCRLFKE